MSSIGQGEVHMGPLKILILKRDKIGDLLLTTPMIEHLSKSLPDAEIDLIASDYNAWVVKDNPYIHKLWVYPRIKRNGKKSLSAAIKQWRVFQKLKRKNYDIVIAAAGEELSQNIKRLKALGGKRRIAYAEDPKLKKYVTDPLPCYGWRTPHETIRILNVLSTLNIPLPQNTIYPAYHTPDEYIRQAKQWLETQGVQRDFVIIGLGARRAKKQLSTTQIIALTQWLDTQHKLDVVFMWTPGQSNNKDYPGDDETAQPVLEAKLATLHPYRGPIPMALGLIALARASIFPDSGLMHFAAASPGGVLGLFAETDVSPPEERWGPCGKKTELIVAKKSISEVPLTTIQKKIEALLSSTPTCL